MEEQLKIIIASYFKYWGAEVAEMLPKVGDYVTQRRIVIEFMRIIEENLLIMKDDELIITDHVNRDIARPVRLFVNLYHLDKQAADTVDKIKELL